MTKPSVFGFVPAVVDYCCQKFPVTCRNCGKVYVSFKDYIKSTKPIGDGPVSYEINSGFDPVRILSYVNCSCHDTMALQCDEAFKESKLLFMDILNAQSVEESRSTESIMHDFRSQVRNRVLEEG